VDENVRQPNVGVVYQYYNARPYFSRDDASAHTGSATAAGTASPLGGVERAGKVIGTAVDNTQNEKLGKVENLVVDLPAGRVVEVILASGGFLGLGDELSAIPPQSFHHGTEHDQFILDATKESLSRAPHFKSREWPDLNNPDNDVSAVYRAYKVDPYFTTNAVDNTAQNVRDRQDNAITPFSQGSSDSDVSTTGRFASKSWPLTGFQWMPAM